MGRKISGRQSPGRFLHTPPPPLPILQSIHPDFLIPVISMSELLPFGYHEDCEENQNVSKELYAIYRLFGTFHVYILPGSVVCRGTFVKSIMIGSRILLELH